MSKELDNFYFVAGADNATLLRCVRCNDANVPYAYPTTGMTLNQLTEAAEAHNQVSHPVKQEKAAGSPWEGITDAVKKDAGQTANELSDALDKAVQAAMTEVMPVVVNILSRFRKP